MRLAIVACLFLLISSLLTWYVLTSNQEKPQSVKTSTSISENNVTDQIIDEGAETSNSSKSDHDVKTDAVSAATVDATTGASQIVEVKVADDMSIRYTTLEDGTLSVTVEELSRAYSLDELAADKIFKGKKMRTWGTVTKKSNPDATNAWIVFSPDATSLQNKNIRCSMQHSVSSELNLGDKITVEGIGAGMTFSINITDGIITK